MVRAVDCGVGVGRMTIPAASTKWSKWKAAILGTLAAAGVWLAAVLAPQLPVDPPGIPMALQGQRAAILTNDYTTEAGGRTITIKAGFRWDGASIPNCLDTPLALDRFSPSLRRGGLVHDALYASQWVSKDVADWCLYDAILNDGTQFEKAKAVYRAVQLWGFTAWDSKTPESIRRAREFVSLQPR